MGEEERRRKKQQAMRLMEGMPGAKEVKKPAFDLSRLVAAKTRVRREVKNREAGAEKVYNFAMEGFLTTTPGLESTMKRKGSDLLRFYNMTQG